MKVLSGDFPVVKSQSQLRAEGKKWCCGCDQIKLLCEYGSAKDRPDEVMSECKDCSAARGRNWRLNNIDKMRKINRDRSRIKRAESNPRFLVVQKLYSTRRNAKLRGYQGCTSTASDLEPLFTTVCQICGTNCGNAICLDHCHNTGKFRGFICNNCNTIIGYAYDSAKRLEDVATYLRKTSA